MNKERVPITIDPDIHSGDPVFTGTRVPIKTLFSHLESGLPLEVFLRNFPSVKPNAARKVLAAAEANLIQTFQPAT